MNNCKSRQIAVGETTYTKKQLQRLITHQATIINPYYTKTKSTQYSVTNWGQHNSTPPIIRSLTTTSNTSVTPMKKIEEILNDTNFDVKAEIEKQKLISFVDKLKTQFKDYVTP